MGAGRAKKNEPDDEEPAWFKAYKKQQEERYNAIKAESDTLKAEKAKNDRANLISAKAKRTRYSGVAHERGIRHRRRCR